VHPFVERAQSTLDSQPAEQRNEPAERTACAVREEQHAEHDGADDEGALDPEIGPDVVVPEGERKPDRGERERGDAAERALEQDDRRQVAEPARVPARGLVDAGGVAVGSTWPAVYDTR